MEVRQEGRKRGTRDSEEQVLTLLVPSADVGKLIGKGVNNTTIKHCNSWKKTNFPRFSMITFAGHCSLSYMLIAES